MDALVRDVRFALRSLRRAPLLTALVVLTLGLGIGVNGAIFSVVDAILWRSWPVEEPDRLALIYARPRSEGREAGWFDWSWVDVQDFRRADVFEDVVAYSPLPLSLSESGGNERLWGEIVSPGYFDLLRVRPQLGRAFSSEEPGDVPPLEVVLSHRLWERRFGADPRVLGRELRLNGHVFTVTGVAPPGFAGVYYPGFVPSLWIPAAAYDRVWPGGAGQLEQRGATGFRALGRLRPGVTVEQAQAAVAGVARRLEELHPTTNAGADAVVLSPQQARPEPSMAAGMTLAGRAFLALTGLVLLVACANVASLLLARATARRREVAIRLALGAGRWRLVRQLLTEALLLAVAGGAAGLLFAHWATDALSSAVRLPSDIPFAFDFGLEPRAVAFTCGVTLLTGIAFGLAPARRASRPELTQALRDAADLRLGGRRVRLTDVLVVAQVAVSCVLLVCAGLAIRTLTRIQAVDPGFDARGALMASVAPGLQGYDNERAAAFYRRLLQSVEGLPGVRSATLAQYPPMEFSASGGNVYVEGDDPAPGEPAASSFWSVVAPRYFETMGTSVHEGRTFAPADDEHGAKRVAVVSEALARRFWPGASAVGRTLRLGTPDAEPVEVVGVVADVKVRNLTERPELYVYLPLSQNPQPQATLILRAAGDPLALGPTVRETVRALDPEMPVYDLKTLEDLVRGRALLTARLGAGLVGAFGALALALAVVGLYGVASYAVSRRLREIGIRIAVGASELRILRGVVGDGLGLALVGLGIGLAAAVAAGRLASGLLYEVSPADPLTFGAIAFLLTAVALAASWLPARRAARVDPVRILRHE